MELLEGLDPAQREAVLCPAQPLCILAGAGSGKTRVLTRRLAHRVLTGAADAGHVLALTFTRKAAAELRSRLEALGVREQVAAGTFHAVAYAQLRRRWADRGERPPVLLERKARLLAPLLPRARTAAAASATVQPADLAAEIEWAKARMVSPTRYEAAAEVARRPLPVPAATMAAIFERYEHEKRRRGLVDFDDLIVGCAVAMETDAEFAAAQRWRYRHLFVDEFQDLNPAQFRLLQAWLGGRADLCVVGDPHQAVYSWNGADPELLTGFCRHFPGAAVTRLDCNHRSTPQVVAVAGTVLAGAREWGAQPRATRPDGPLPVVRRFDTDRAELRGIARILNRAHQPGVLWSHLAVLARTNAQLAVMAEHLRGAGIPCRVSGEGALLRQPEVRAALEQLRRAPAAVPLSARLADVEAMAAEDGAEERRQNLHALVQLGRDYAAVDAAPSLEGFLAWLGSGGQQDEADARGDVVELTTFHRAKGLEWPVVVVAGLERGLVPIGHADTPAAQAEERRLLYVAMTRARDQLHCTWAERRTFGSRSVSRSPSPYLEAVEETVAALGAGADPADLALGRPAGASGPGAGAWKDRLREDRARLRTRARTGGPRPHPHDTADPVLLQALKEWRSAAARASGVPAYVIFHDATLAALAEARPSTRAELLALPGLGPVKADRYGDTLLALLAAAAS